MYGLGAGRSNSGFASNSETKNKQIITMTLTKEYYWVLSFLTS